MRAYIISLIRRPCPGFAEDWLGGKNYELDRCCFVNLYTSLYYMLERAWCVPINRGLLKPGDHHITWWFQSYVLFSPGCPSKRNNIWLMWKMGTSNPDGIISFTMPAMGPHFPMLVGSGERVERRAIGSMDNEGEFVWSRMVSPPRCSKTRAPVCLTVGVHFGKNLYTFLGRTPAAKQTKQRFIPVPGWYY